MQINKLVLIIIAAIGTALVAYSPHYHYPFPSHIDEWHHISEAIRLQKGEYIGGVTGYRVGFQLLLVPLLKFTDPIKFYKFLPAAWAVISGLSLFYLVYKKTGKQFFVALFAMIFFASIKSNVNITGLWFFTPLSFCIPFIYLYVYLFTEGAEKQNKKLIIASLAVMVLIIPFHSISFLFSVPFLLIYSLFNIGYFKKEWKFFSIFLIVPLFGLVFFKFMTKIPWHSLAGKTFSALQFKRGWGVLEIENSFFELYSMIGYILAALGLLFIFTRREYLKKYLAYGLWPIAVLASILFYRKADVSYLSPYQRNLYYFAVSLPLLSALGLDYLFKMAVKLADRFKSLKENIKLKAAVIQMISIIVIFFAFKSYWNIPKQIDLYEVIDEDEYEAFLFLKKFPPAVVMSSPRISTGLFPITGHTPVADYFFYGNRADAERFFYTDECAVKEELIKKYKVKYVLSRSPIDCGWTSIYKRSGVYIYEID